MKTAFLYPGQGAQKVGMGRDLYRSFPAAREVFEQVQAACNLPLARLCFEGPQEELSRTDICQLGIFAVSAATLAVMREVLAPDRMPQPAFMAGLSLGEYTALYAAGAMDLPSAAELVARRGELMQGAAATTPSAMVCVMGLDEKAAGLLCQAAAQGQTLVCANFNCPGQIVLSGHRDACERAAARARDFGASGIVALNVAGAFHSPLMQPAADRLAEALDAVALADPKVTVIANADAQPYRGAGEIKHRLMTQLVSPVRWQQSMEYLLAQGVRRFYEIGPSRVLAGLMRRISRQAHVTCVNCLEAVRRLSGLRASSNGSCPDHTS